MLKWIQKAREEREGGFTLIEMLIVIVVLGILAGIVVFGVSTFREDSKAAACKADIKTVEVATDAFKAKTGGWPTAPASPANATFVDRLVNDGYLKSKSENATFVIDGATGKVTGTCVS
jgi:general secretion pathway protein G